MQNVVLLGMPGSGKSAVGRMYAGLYDYTYIGSGDIARSMAQDDERAKLALQEGDYAPESAMRMEIQARMEAAAIAGSPVVLDGFPRMLAQYLVLERITKNNIYVEVSAPTVTCIHRIIERGRDTDEPDAVASRFKAYETDTKPLIEALGPYCMTLFNSGDLHGGVTLLRGLVERHGSFRSPPPH